MAYIRIMRHVIRACSDMHKLQKSDYTPYVHLPSTERNFVRFITQSRKSASKENSSPETKPNVSSNFKGRPQLTQHVPNAFEKWLLVYFKKYPSVAEVPQFVSHSVMERVRNLARIRANILFCFLAVLTCIAMIISGKTAARRGESVVKQNLDWHKSIEEKAKK